MDFFVDFQSSLLRGREMCFYVLNDNFLKQYFALKKVFQVMQKKFFQVFFSTSVFLEHKVLLNCKNNSRLTFTIRNAYAYCLTANKSEIYRGKRFQYWSSP